MESDAQSSTDFFWACEDFTHRTLFTSDCLEYVLTASVFSSVEFINIDCTEETTSYIKRVAWQFLMRLYRWSLGYWNKVTESSDQAPSSMIFFYEIKVLARV